MARLPNRNGFTLIEMAVVIVVVGIIISIVASVLPSLIQSSKIKQAQALLEKADYALQGYSLANFRLPFADNTVPPDGLEDTDVYVGNLPYRTLGLSSGVDVWGEPIKYAVYGAAGGLNNLTQNFADANAFCIAINAAAGAGTPFDSAIVHTTTDPACAATAANASNQAYVLACGGLHDLDGANGRFDGCNGAAGAGFNIPGTIQSTTYDDLVRDLSLAELNQKNCSGSGGGGGGGGTPEDCSTPGDEDSDGLPDCADPDCAAFPACSTAFVDITTTTVPIGTLTAPYMTSFAATGGTTPYQWSLVNNGGFSDMTINPSTGSLTCTLTQCPGSYNIAVQVQDSTPAGSGGPYFDSQTVALQVDSALTVTRTSGAGSDITWSSAGQQETFGGLGGRLDILNWSLDTGGATGFGVFSTGADSCVIRKTGGSIAGLYTFTLTATDAACPTNTADLILIVTISVAGAGAPGVIDDVVDSMIFDNQAGYNPDIIHIGGEIYAVAYTGQGSDGYVRTVRIAADGQIDNAAIDSLGGGSTALDLDFVHVTGEIYALAYRDGSGRGSLVTLRIAADGQIDNLLIDGLTFDNSCQEPDLIAIGGDIFAVAYTGAGNDGFVRTVQIAADGQITDSVIDSLEFDTANGVTVDMLHIAGEIYAAAYRGSGNDGFVCTFSIDAAGQISNSRLSVYEFDTADCTDPDMVAVSGDIYAIAYAGTGGDGFIRTIQIAADGTITPSILDTLEFDTSTGVEPVIITVGANVFGIAYRGPGNDGFFATVQIDDAGQIGDTVMDILEYDTVNGYEPSIVSAGAGIFAVAHRGQANRGTITTIRMQ